MRLILAAGICAPLLINAQEHSSSTPEHFVSGVDQLWHRLNDAVSTSTTWVTVPFSGTVSPTTTGEDASATSEIALPTRGLVPIPVAARPSSTSTVFASGLSSTGPVVVVVVPATGVAWVTVSTAPASLGHTITMDAQPTFMPPELAGKREAWRFASAEPCKKGGKWKGSKQDCRRRRCMWEHTKPLNITRAWHAVEFPVSWTNMTNANSVMGNDSAIDLTLSNDQYRHVWAYEDTFLNHSMHWGTTKSGLYYDHRTLVSSVEVPATTIIDETRTIVIPVHGTIRSKVERVLPTAPPANYEPAPLCSTLDECAQQCDIRESKRSTTSHRVKMGLIVGTLGLLGLLFLICCLCCCRRRRKASNPAAKEPVEVAVVPITRAVDPVTGAPIVTRPGTQGRQAEEGRSRVHFPENETGQHPAEKPAGVAAAATEHPAPATAKEPEKMKEAPDHAAEKAASKSTPAAEHVEAIPAHDGADSRPTGSQRFDMGSMRGRKKIRADLKNIF